MIENVIINQSKWTQRDIEILFDNESVHFSDCTLIEALLRELNIFKSANQARQAGRKGPIPEGWTEFKASKKRRLWIWNPSE